MAYFDQRGPEGRFKARRRASECEEGAALSGAGLLTHSTIVASRPLGGLDVRSAPTSRTDGALALLTRPATGGDPLLRKTFANVFREIFSFIHSDFGQSIFDKTIDRISIYAISETSLADVRRDLENFRDIAMFVFGRVVDKFDDEDQGHDYCALLMMLWLKGSLPIVAAQFKLLFLANKEQLAELLLHQRFIVNLEFIFRQIVGSEAYGIALCVEATLNHHQLIRQSRVLRMEDDMRDNSRVVALFRMPKNGETETFASLAPNIEPSSNDEDRSDLEEVPSDQRWSVLVATWLLHCLDTAECAAQDDKKFNARLAELSRLFPCFGEQADASDSDGEDPPCSRSSDISLEVASLRRRAASYQQRGYDTD